MQNIISRCTAHLSFVHNGQANILLPLVNVEVEVHTGKTENSMETLGFVGTPRGIRALIETLTEALSSFEEVSKSQPVITSEEEWIAKMAEMRAQMEAEAGDPSVVMNRPAEDILTEAEVAAALDGNVVPFGKMDN